MTCGSSKYVNLLDLPDYLSQLLISLALRVVDRCHFVDLAVIYFFCHHGNGVTSQFYAPWCTYCKQLDPIWHQIGSELKSLGSPINVGKSDASTSTGE